MVSKRFARLFVPIAGVLTLMAVSLIWSQAASSAPSNQVRINAGGAAQTVDGTSWAGCTAISSCGGYVSGGFPWSENPSSISGVTSPDSSTIEKSEWSAGSTSGVTYGATAFTFTIPVAGSDSYNVLLHFTETNKTAVGQRVFDVKINGATVLSNFDIFKSAGGEFKTIVESFNATPVNGNVTISFIRKTENAKVSAIEVLGAGTSSSTSTSTSTTAAPVSTTTSTTAPSTLVGKLSWSTIANAPKPGVEAGGGAIGNKMYLFGGYYNNNWVPTNTAEVYDPAANTWSSLPSVPRTLTHTATVENGRDFIMAGGYSTNSSGAQIYGITNVYDFNVDTKTWSNLPSLPVARGSGGLALVNGTLHFFGGVDPNRNEQSDHWTLNLSNLGSGWQKASAFPILRTHFATIVVGNSIYVIGGLTGVDAGSTDYAATYRYDTTTDSWTTLASMGMPLSHMTDAAVLYNNRIWVFGGEKSYNATQSESYIYDIASNKWTSNTNLPSPRYASNAVNINGTFYFANGSMTSTTAWKASAN